MKLISICFIIYLSLDISICSHFPSSPQNVANKNQSEELKHVKNATSFWDLNFDCQLLVCEVLNLFDLLSLTETNAEILPVAEDILRRKFAKKAVIYHVQQLNFQAEASSSGVQEFDNEIVIGHGATIWKIVEHFGHLINILKIVHIIKVPDNIARNFYQLINLHCADTLRQFHISNQNNDLLAELATFKKVETVSLDGHHKTSCNVAGHKQFIFSNLFPNCRHLILDNNDEQYLLLSEQIIPHLEELSVECWGNLKPSLVQKLIRNHPQIRRLYLRYAAPDLLVFVNNKLPHLESLELERFLNSDRDVNIHFQHLKRFSVKGINKITANITFQELEEFESDGSLRGRTGWIELVKNQRSLKKVVFNDILSDSEILGLAEVKMNATEVHIGCSPTVTVESLAELMGHCRKLEKLRIFYNQDDQWTVTLDESTLTFDLLKEKFASEWIINRTPLYVDFTRIEAEI